METKNSKIKRETMFEILEQAAKNYGFDNVWSSQYGTFVAEHRTARVEMRVDKKFGKMVAEISWASAGTPRPTNDEVCKHIEMVGKAHALKMLFETLEAE